MSKFGDILDALGLAADLANDVAEYDAANANLIALQQTKKATIAAKRHSDTIGKNYTAKNTAVTTQLSALKTEQDNILLDLERYDLNTQDLFDLSDKERTPFGNQSLEDIGVVHGENLMYTAAIADDAEGQLENYENLLNLNKEVNNRLRTRLNEVLSLEDMVKDVKDVAGWKGIVDAKDFEAHIQKNPDTFALKDADGNIIRDEKGMFETNELAKAFLSEEQNVGGTDYGFVPKITTADLKRHGINPNTGEPIEKEQSINLSLEINALSKSIKDVKSIHADEDEGYGKFYSKGLDEANLDDIETRLGTGKGKMYDNLTPKQAQALKTDIAGWALGMIDRATQPGKISFWDSWSDETKEPAHKNLRKIAGFEKGIAKGWKNVNPILQDVYMRNIVERHIGGGIDTEITHPKTGAKFTQTIPAPKLTHGVPGQGGVTLLNQTYAEDKIYHGVEPTGMDEGAWSRDIEPVEYGTTAEDRLYYDLLNVWQILDEKYPSIFSSGPK